MPGISIEKYQEWFTIIKVPKQAHYTDIKTIMIAIHQMK